MQVATRPSPEEAIAALTPQSTTTERMAAMRVFVERWYGMTQDGHSASMPLNVPEPLRLLHELVANRQIFGHNSLVEPNDLVVEDGKMIFYVENQGVCTWAIEPIDDDPPVFVRGNSWGDPWIQEAPTLSGFLIQAVIYETVLSCEFFDASTDRANEADLRKLKRHVASIAVPPWASSETEFFASNGIIGFAVPDADLFRVNLAAREGEFFEAIEELMSDWPNIGF